MKAPTKCLRRQNCDVAHRRGATRAGSMARLLSFDVFFRSLYCFVHLWTLEKTDHSLANTS